MHHFTCDCGHSECKSHPLKAEPALMSVGGWVVTLSLALHLMLGTPQMFMQWWQEETEEGRTLTLETACQVEGDQLQCEYAWESVPIEPPVHIWRGSTGTWEPCETLADGTIHCQAGEIQIETPPTITIDDLTICRDQHCQGWQ